MVNKAKVLLPLLILGDTCGGQRIVRKVMAGAHIQMTPEDDPTSCTGSRMVAG